MQISELEENKLSQICGFLKNKKVYALYLADSLGALTLKKMKNLIKTLKQCWDKERTKILSKIKLINYLI